MEIDETPGVLPIGKHIEYFDATENKIKNLEDKYVDSFEAVENIIKSQEDKMDSKLNLILRLLGGEK